MKKNINISVIIPFYNTVKNFGSDLALIRCLDSLIKQEQKDLEFIFIDNNSEDESRGIIENYSKKDNRIKLETEITPGVSNARNLGISKANGRYITFIDSDDYIGNNYFSKAVNLIKNKNPDMIIGDFKVCYPNGEIGTTYRTAAFKKYKNDIKKLFPFIECPHNIFCRSDIIKNNNLKQNQNIRIGEDNLFNAHMMINSEKIECLNNNDYFYQVYGGNSSHIKSDKFLDFVLAYDEIFTLFEKRFGKISNSLVKYVLSKRRDFSSVIESQKIFDEELVKIFKKHNIGSKYIDKIKDFSDISVVVQGAIDPKQTPICLKSIRKHLPGATIIISTWDGTDSTSINGLYDEVVFNKDPGASTYSGEKGSKLNNVNRQIVSTFGGVKNVKTKYTLKFRADFFLTGNDFLNFFNKYNNFSKELRMVKKRMLVCSLYTRNPNMRSTPFPFHVSDFVFFGLTEDLYNVFNIPLMSTNEAEWFINKEKPRLNNNLFNFQHRYFPEQHIWLNFLKYKDLDFFADISNNNIKASILSFVNNIVILSPKQLNVASNKPRLFKDRASTCFNYYDWLLLYKKYCDKNLYIPCQTKIKIFIFSIINIHYVSHKIFNLSKFIYYKKVSTNKIIIKILKIPVYKKRLNIK